MPPTPDPEPAAPPTRTPVLRDPEEASLWYLAAAGALYAGLLWSLFQADASSVERAETDVWAFLWLQVVDDGLLVGVALLFGLTRFPGSWRGLGFRSVNFRWYPIGAAAGILAAALAWVVSLGVERTGIPLPAHPVETVLAHAADTRAMAVVLAGVTLPVAIGEETFFRGYAYRLLRARFGVTTGIVASAMLFALVHGLEPGAWLPIVPVGLVFAVVAEKSGSVAPAMVGHVVVNALAVLAGEARGGHI